MVTKYLDQLEPEEQLFKFTSSRALQITKAILQVPNHRLRAFGESYLYSVWDHDILAVADYVKVDDAILQKYIRRGYEKYQVA